MMLRLEQKSLVGLKYAFQNFFPHYIEHDLQLPERVEFEVGAGDILGGIFTYNVLWEDIYYNNILFDIIGIKIAFIGDDEGLGDKIKIDFPALKDLYVYAY